MTSAAVIAMCATVLDEAEAIYTALCEPLDKFSKNVTAELARVHASRAKALYQRACAAASTTAALERADTPPAPPPAKPSANNPAGVYTLVPWSERVLIADALRVAAMKWSDDDGTTAFNRNIRAALELADRVVPS